MTGPVVDPAAPVDWNEAARQQSVGPADPNDPINLGDRQSRFPKSDPAHEAGPDVQAGASLATQLEDKVRFFARKRFPDKPLVEAMSRYGADANGRVYYVDDQGQKFFEEAGTGDFGTLRGTANLVAKGAGPALPIAGSIAGAAASLPFAGGIPGAAAGAAAGDAARQGLANLVIGGTGFDVGQTAIEAALGAGGQGLAKLAVVFKNRRLAKDFARVAGEDAQKAITMLRQRARDEGIDLTPAELTNLRSLVAQQRMLQDLPRSGDRLQAFNLARDETQIPEAVHRRLDAISNVSSREAGGRQLAEGANLALEAAKETRRKATAPMFEQAFAEGRSVVNINSVVANIQRQIRQFPPGGEVAKKLTKALRLVTDFVEEGGEGAVIPQTDPRILHNAQVEIGEMIDTVNPDKRLGPTAKRALAGVHKDLITKLERFNPAYARARMAYKKASAPVDALRKGAVGTVADLEGEAVTRSPKAIFAQGPEAIARDRAAFQDARAMDQWNAGLRSFIEDAFDKASKARLTAGGAAPGAKFRIAVFGDKRQREAMKAALGPIKFGGFERLMQVLEAAGRVPRAGSDTFMKQEAARELRRQSGAVVRTLTRIPSLNVLRDIGEWWAELRMGRNSAKLAEIITSPQNMERMRELRRVSPFGEKARTIVWQLLFRGGEAGVKTAIPAPAVEPGAIGATSPGRSPAQSAGQRQ